MCKIVPMLCALTLTAAPLVAVGEHEKHDSQSTSLRIGKVNFPNSGSAQAQEPFLRGMALLHSYQYYDARAAFRQASDADPAFALAYWAEAFTHSQFDWGTEDLAAARATLERLAPTVEERLAKAGNAREREFGAALETFLDGRGAPIDRARKLAAALDQWSANAPADLEAAAFAARAALYVVRYAPPAEALERVQGAIARAEKVVAANPQHPGGLHYLIHATDSPRFAEKGLAAARAYDQLAPDADHALHMPSHIYLQLGMWPDVSASNERAWQASQAWAKRGNHSATDLGWHSLQWLQYSYLQEGRYREAQKLIHTAKKILAKIPRDALVGEPDAQFAVETMQFQYGVETEDWSRVHAYKEDVSALVAQAVAAPSIRERQRAISAASHVVVAFVGQRNQTSAAEAVRDMRAAVAGRPADDPTRKQVETQAAQMDALIAQARGDRTDAVERFRRLAGQMSSAGIAPIGPPSLLPHTELLAAALMEAQQYSEAASAYERALAERPKRSAALLGLARAKRAAGDAAGASDAYEQLLANWERADANVRELSEARANSQGSAPAK